MGSRRRQAGNEKPSKRAVGAGWEERTPGVLLGLRDWRALHPKATLAEIEEELDARWNELRAHLMADLALASGAATLDEAERPACAACGGRLTKDGQHVRTVWTTGNQPVRLERTYARCPACESRAFPPG